MTQKRIAGKLVFEVVQEITRHGQRLTPGAKIMIGQRSSRVHVDRWISQGKLKEIGRSGICRSCGCTATDCRGCIERTGKPCAWLDPEETLCSACTPEEKRQLIVLALACLAVQRPGWNLALRDTAELFSGQVMFDQFKRLQK